METFTCDSPINLLKNWYHGDWILKVLSSQKCIVSGTNSGKVLFYNLDDYGYNSQINMQGEITAICAAKDFCLIGSLGGDVLKANWSGTNQDSVNIPGACVIIPRHNGFLIGTRNGQLNWMDEGLSLTSKTAIDSIWDLRTDNRMVVAASTQGSITVLDSYSEEIIWKREYRAPVYGIELADKALWIGTAEGMIEVFEDSFRMLGQLNTPGVRIIKRAGDRMLVCFVDGSIGCFDLGLEKQWSFRTASWIKDVKVNDDIIVIGSADHNIYVLNYQGEMLFKYRTGYSVMSVDLEDNVIIAGSADGNTYAFFRDN
ncbi:MAG: hypothetical protein ACM3QW_09730 [Ignavibacteriales bacterium]